MKRLLILFMLFLSPSAFAGDTEIEHYIDTLIKMKQTEITQLENALNKLRAKNLSEQEKFEQIGGPSFQAVEQGLAENGYTILNLLEFGAQNEEAISQWLIENQSVSRGIDTLELEKEALLKEYDILIQPTAAAPANQGEKP